jgi:LuxR family quorum-sensing transcriptional regulator LasR
MDHAFDASEFDQLLPFASLNQASSDAAAFTSLTAAARGLGFEQVMFAVIPQPKVSLDDAFLRTNYPVEWRGHYDRQNMRVVDPTVEYCFRSNAPLVWLPQAFKTQVQQSMYEEAAAFGLRAGVTLPIHGPGGEVGMLTCVRDEMPGPAFMKDLYQNLGALTLLRDMAFDAMKGHIHKVATQEPAPVLTARELDCLQWMTAGKTAWEIGRILSISEAGVNFHISNLRTKFNVSKRTDVVLKAIRLGLVSMPG